MKLPTDLILKIEQLPKLKWEDKGGKVEDLEFKYKWEGVEKIQKLILEKVYSKTPKEKVLKILLSNGFNEEEANRLITFTLSAIFKNSSYWHRDDPDGLETFVEEVDSRLESPEKKDTQYRYKPLSFRVDIELTPNWFNIIKKIAKKNDLTALDYFRDFLTDSGFDKTHLADRKKNPKLLKTGDIIEKEEKLREILDYASLDSWVDNFKNGFLGKSFNFTYFSDTISGMRLDFGAKIGGIGYEEKKILLSGMSFKGKIVSDGDRYSRNQENSLPDILSVIQNFVTPESPKYYKYLPLFNNIHISPDRMVFEDADELGQTTVYHFYFADESIKKLEWKRDENFPMFPILNEMVEFYLSKNVFSAEFYNKNEKNEFPNLIQNLLKKNGIKYLGETGIEYDRKRRYEKWSTFEGEYCKTRINVEVFSPEITIHPMEYYVFDVDNNLDGIHACLKGLGYLK